MKIQQEVEQQTPCVECKYYFGNQKIHCAIYPEGKQTTYCTDWQLEKNSLEQKNLMVNKLETLQFSSKKTASILLGIAGTIFIGYVLYQNISVAIAAQNNYDKYSQEGKVFLERAGSAGTIGVVEKELVKAVNWLEINYSTESFEYRDLQVNLKYLQKQPDDLVIPYAIKDSIKQNTNAIKSEQLKKLNAGGNGLYGIMFFLLLGIPLIILAIMLIETTLESQG